MYSSTIFFSTLCSLLWLSTVAAVAIPAPDDDAVTPDVIRNIPVVVIQAGTRKVPEAGADFTVIGLDVVQDTLYFWATPNATTPGGVSFEIRARDMLNPTRRQGSVDPFVQGPGEFYVNLGPNRDLVKCHLQVTRSTDLAHTAIFFFQDPAGHQGSYLYPCFAQGIQDWVQVNCGGSDNEDIGFGASCLESEWADAGV